MMDRCACGHLHGSRVECPECESAGRYCHYSVPLMESPAVGSPRWENRVTIWLVFCCFVALIIVILMKECSVTHG